MTATAPTGGSKTSDKNIFQVGNVDEAYWETYLSHRPKYSADFYDRIFNYHKEHNPTGSSKERTVAHDIGTGPGQVASVLAQHFDHVIASDLNPTHLSIAGARLKELLPPHASPPRLTLVQSSGEAIASNPAHPAHSASMVAAAECMPLMDAPAAIAAWSQLLAPHGTLAIWFYGRPAFADAGLHATCQPLFDALENAAFKRVVADSGNEERRQAFVRAGVAINSWLEHFALPEADWTDVRRTKWNADYKPCFYDAEVVGGEPMAAVSLVGPHERVEQVRDRAFWAERWAVDDVRKFIDVNLPKIAEDQAAARSADPRTERLYRELEQAMGGPGAKADITWPVVLVLATRK